MMKCELCRGVARLHCESDQASLCWDCDLKVHGANFLVAKHTRTLLCHVCQNPTPWLASGHHLSPALSVCDSCVANNDNTCQLMEESEESSEVDYDEQEEEDEDYENDDDEEEEDAENQVVPWSADSSSFSITKPMVSSDSSSTSTEGGGGGGDGDGAGFRLKRMRRNLSFCSEDEIGCFSSHVGSGGTSNGEASWTSRLAEVNRAARNQDHGETESRSTAIIRSLKRLQKHMIVDDGDASATIIGICRLSRDQSR